MPRVLSQDLRERVVAAVEGGMSCRRAAERFGVSAASAIRWRQLVLQHDTPAAKTQGGDQRSAPIEDHAGLIHAAIEQQADITLEFNLFGGTATSVTFSITDNEGQLFTFANLALGNGENFFGFQGIQNKTIRNVVFTLNGGGISDVR
jgi:transposase-like protein